MVIFQGCVTHRNYKDGISSSWFYAASESGYMDGELFSHWFEMCFVPNCGRERPVCIVMDNHGSHITLRTVETAIANDIVLVGLPAHTTYILQPLDVKIIGPLKGRVATMAERCWYLNTSFTSSKAKFPVLLNYAIEQTTAGSVKEAFRATGIHPVSMDAIDQSQLVPSTFIPPSNIDNVTPESSEDQVKTCPTCGAFNQNPIVRDGLIPEGLAKILTPLPTKTNTTQKKSRVVLEGILLIVPAYHP